MNSFSPLIAQSTVTSNSSAVVFILYTLLVFFLAWLASRRQHTEGFLGEYFLGSRNLGMWGFALTFAATSASGGSFMGFPSKIYTHGWSLGLWIASYMLAPLIAMGLLAKRLNQVSRKADAITLPDVMRARFDSSAVGILATVLLIFFMAFNLVAQFKAGTLILNTLVESMPFFQDIRTATATAIEGRFFIGQVEPGYLVCLLFFAVAVIIYTAYGGFRAVVWTDVLQGAIMSLGVLVMLPLVLYQVGGLSHATKELYRMQPPVSCQIRLESDVTSSDDDYVLKGTWLEQVSPEGPTVYYRLAKRALFAAGETTATATDGQGRTVAEVPAIRVDVPTDWTPPAHQLSERPLRFSVLSEDPYAYGDRTAGVYVRNPGPHPSKESGFLPLSLAVSFFFFWTFSGAGQPASMVRLMAFDDTATLRRSIVTVAMYYSLIYFPLVTIFCCARLLMPGMEIESDRIMPALASEITMAAGVPWLAGLLIAAPFAAVMSTVDSFLLMISSAVVRDVYQQHYAPNASEKRIRVLTYVVTTVVGIAALIGALRPPAYLQDLIVFTTGGLSGCFLTAVLLGLYWPRFNAAGAIASMLAGFLTHTVLYLIGWATAQAGESVDAYAVFGMDAFITDTVISIAAAVLVTRCTAPPSEELTTRFFGTKN